MKTEVIFEFAYLGYEVIISETIDDSDGERTWFYDYTDSKGEKVESPDGAGQVLDAIGHARKFLLARESDRSNLSNKNKVALWKYQLKPGN